VVGREVGHGGVVAERVFHCHKDGPIVKTWCHLSAAKQIGGSCERVRRPRTRPTRQTRRSPTHSRHKT
jgi:hypothetical protein